MSKHLTSLNYPNIPHLPLLHKANHDIFQINPNRNQKQIHPELPYPHNPVQI